MSGDSSDLVVIGRVSGVYGVRGWVKVYSYTEPREGILDYLPWQVRVGGQWQAMRVSDGRLHGKGVIAKLDGYDDPESAKTLRGADIAVHREQLPPPEEGRYYWSDLIGLEVVTLDGVALGKVDHLLETGANDVLVVQGERERLIPFIDQVVIDVDLVGKMMRVDWDPEF
ncbi:MAG: ribosome maturation factor RimM [Gammaproteobacteria bacterium]|nr:ribosome maturation factor RimM [Gammaproteobacteria bacterium]